MASRHRPAPEDGFCRNREIAYLADEYPLFNLGQLGLDCRGQVVAVEEAVEVLVKIRQARALAGTSCEDPACRLALIGREGLYNDCLLPWQNIGLGQKETCERLTILVIPPLPTQTCPVGAA